MTLLKHVSLGDQISKKMSIWILVFVVIMTAAVCFVSFIQSRQMFLKQVESWRRIVPEQALTNLIDSDDFSIQREVRFIQSTGLFSSFYITDNQKRAIASFGEDKFNNNDFVPIRDDAKVIWGYYFLKPDFERFFAPFFISGIAFLILITLLYFFIRWRIKLNLETEFTRFNEFLNEIEILTEKIHDIYHEEDALTVQTRNPSSAEQLIINKAISKLLDEIRKANKSLREAIASAEQKRFQDELTATALQVAHDIGSPLATLEAIVQSASLVLPEESRVAIRNAAAKMRDITNSLLRKAKRDLLSTNEASLTQQLLYSLISQVITEKRLQYQKNTNVNIRFEFDASSYGLFVIVRAADFSRVLSNIISNAVESRDAPNGEVSISMHDGNDHATVRVKDNGKGIPRNLLPKLGQLGVTYEKAEGNGLGLFHAKTTIENWGGKLAIQSKEGFGTEVMIALPKALPPEWFAPELRIADDQETVIVDDDEAIHEVWRERFKSCQIATDKLLHFYSPDELVKWKEEVSVSSNILCLCDYEFVGSSVNGIELIKKLGLNFFSILVTNRFYSDEVIMECEASRLKLLPKDMASIVPIVSMS